MSFTYPDRCFLSAVRADGFCSLLADAASGYERVYILYGAAGTGRAQAMTAAAGKLLSHGAEIWTAVDPLDPKRVEGVFAPSAGVAVISGDFPHLICAVRPCLREITVDFNAACSAERLQSEIDAVETVYSARDSLYARASRYMSAASSLLGDSFRIAADCTDGKKAAQFAMMSTARLLGRRQKRSGTERLCYLSAVTPDGIAFDGDALVSAADSLLIIDDDCGAAARVIMTAVRHTALELGYDIVTGLSPLFAGEVAEQVIVPDARVAFCTENRLISLDADRRRYHARRFTDIPVMKKHRQRLSFNRKACDELLRGAAASLDEAREQTRLLQSLYAAACDLDATAQITERLLRDI